jgi:hypothetical protein
VSHLPAVRLLFLALAFAGAGCGQKGPPLAPLRRVPAGLQDFSARRTAGTVRLVFTPPAANTDGSTPADLGRVEVYALTVAKPEEAPAGDAFLQKASVVATLDKPVPGERATLEEQITTQEDQGAVRVYVAVAVSRRGGNRSPASPRAVVSLADAPSPAGGVGAHHDAKAITVEWLPATPAASAYNVYETKDGVDGASPLNASPLKTPPFTDARLAFGVERCYVVRALSGADTAFVESESSDPACVTPRDTFAPAAPTGLTVVGGEGVISLIWDANSEPDLGGYLVLRGEAPGEKLTRLTPDPIRDTTFRDENVKPGVRYVYAVVAVDTATPPNVSPQARVEEIAR